MAYIMWYIATAWRGGATLCDAQDLAVMLFIWVGAAEPAPCDDNQVNRWDSKIEYNTMTMTLSLCFLQHLISEYLILVVFGNNTDNTAIVAYSSL